MLVTVVSLVDSGFVLVTLGYCKRSRIQRKKNIINIRAPSNVEVAAPEWSAAQTDSHLNGTEH